MSRSARLLGIAVLLAGAALAIACGDGSRSEAIARSVVAWAVTASPGTGAPAPEGTRPGRPEAAQAPGPADASPEGRAPGDVYYRYEQPGGSVRFVRSLAEIPPEARAGAERIAIASRPQPRAGASAARPAAPRPRRAERTAPVPTQRRDVEVVVYTASWCGWCRKTLAWLDARGVPYENRDIEKDPRWRAELIEKTGRTSIPVVDIGGSLVRGYDPAALSRLL